MFSLSMAVVGASPTIVVWDSIFPFSYFSQVWTLRPNPWLRFWWLEDESANLIWPEIEELDSLAPKPWQFWGWVDVAFDCGTIVGTSTNKLALNIELSCWGMIISFYLFV